MNKRGPRKYNLPLFAALGGQYGLNSLFVNPDVNFLPPASTNPSEGTHTGRKGLS